MVCNDTPGEKRGWLSNPSPSKSLPTSGWQWADGKGGWHDPGVRGGGMGGQSTPTPGGSSCIMVLVTMAGDH